MRCARSADVACPQVLFDETRNRGQFVRRDLVQHADDPGKRTGAFAVHRQQSGDPHVQRLGNRAHHVIDGLPAPLSICAR